MIAANKITENRDHWRSWIWLCPWVMLGLAVGIMLLLGLSIWTALLAAMVLICPALILWGAIQVRRPRKRF